MYTKVEYRVPTTKRIKARKSEWDFIVDLSISLS